MDIKYFGHSSFLLRSKSTGVLTDPYDEYIGFKLPKIEADIVTVSHEHKDHNNPDIIEGEPLIIRLPGEYEKGGVRISGIETYHDKKRGSERGKNTMYKIEIDNIIVLHCGDLGHILRDEILEEIGEIDILLIPCGGIYTIGPEEAVHVVNGLGPSVVIPMHYRQEGLDEKTFRGLFPVSEFITKLGVTSDEPVRKTRFNKGELGEEMKVVVMKRG